MNGDSTYSDDPVAAGGEWEREVERLKAEVVHWKANHDNQVRIKQMLQQRPDLGDRAQSVAQMLAENERLKAEREWQPIETAPHSTWVLLSHAAWIRSAEGLRFNGVWINEDYDPQPTHWMPLPKPPEAK